MTLEWLVSTEFKQITLVVTLIQMQKISWGLVEFVPRSKLLCEIEKL